MQSYEYMGRQLAEWIPLLTSPDPESRNNSANAICAIQMGCSDGTPSPESFTKEQRVDFLRKTVERVLSNNQSLQRALLRCYCEKIERTKRKEYNFTTEATFHSMAVQSVLRNLGPYASSLLPQLCLLLQEDHALDQGFAAEIIAEIQPSDSATIQALIDCVLKNGPNQMPYQKGIALAKVAGNDPTVVAKLCDALESESEKSRQGAAATLREFGSKAAPAIPALLKATHHPDAELRSIAAQALGAIGEQTPEIIDAILRLSRDPDWWVRGSAAQAIGDIKIPSIIAIPRLVEMLEDDGGDGDWNVRDKALASLAEYGEDERACAGAR